VKWLKSKRVWLFLLTLGLGQIKGVEPAIAAKLSPENQALVVAGLAVVTKVLDEAAKP
jgi:hypothetical protein